CVAMEQLKAKWTAEARAEARAEALAEGLAKGCAEGRAEGLAEGLAKGCEVNALNALRLKLSFEDVSRITGLSIEKISSLANAIGLAGEAS
ncbi:MAG: hypothetical protein IKS20_07195, partial [Victivallales bacterium]|nr:hypothetical protein [Victivallales bacterium]